MSYFRDWPLRLELHPSSSIGKNCFRVLAYFYVSLLLICCWHVPWVLFTFPLLYFHLKLIYERYVSLKHPGSVVALECLDGGWKFQNPSKECQKQFELEAYAFNAFFVTLLFRSSNRHFGIFQERKRLLIFADQLAEEDYRKLIVCLKYGRSDLKGHAKEKVSS